MTERDQLVRDLALIAGDLDRRLYPYTGVLRRAARALLETDTPTPPSPDGCRGCGVPIPYAGRGRPRVWCPDCGPGRKKTGNGPMNS